VTEKKTKPRDLLLGKHVANMQVYIMQIRQFVE